MTGYNKVILIGNLTRDPELKYTNSGTAIAEFGLAVNGSRKDDQTVFVDVTAWEKTAENCAKYLTRGRPVLVEGRLVYEYWDDKQSGKKRSRLTVNAISVVFLGSRDEGTSSGTERAQEDSDVPF